MAALLADTRRPAHFLGGRFTDAVARYTAAHLRILRPRIHHIDGQPGNWRDQLVDIGRRVESVDVGRERTVRRTSRRYFWSSKR